MQKMLGWMSLFTMLALAACVDEGREEDPAAHPRTEVPPAATPTAPVQTAAELTRMQEFVAFLSKFRFPAPELMARLSVWAQFAVGAAFIGGLLTRWAGVICAINFIVAIVMVDRFTGLRGAFPSACLVLIGIYLATRGAGRFGIDSIVRRS